VNDQDGRECVGAIISEKRDLFTFDPVFMAPRHWYTLQSSTIGSHLSREFQTATQLHWLSTNSSADQTHPCIRPEGRKIGVTMVEHAPLFPCRPKASGSLTALA
jgi:hypothetical protein